jgi:hypothetical protein
MNGDLSGTPRILTSREVLSGKIADAAMSEAGALNNLQPG